MWWLIPFFVILPCILVNKLTQHLVSYQSSAESRLVIWPPERYKRSPFYTWEIRLPTWNLPLQNSFVRLRKTSAGQFTCLEVSEPCATVYSQHLAYTGKVFLSLISCATVYSLYRQEIQFCPWALCTPNIWPTQGRIFILNCIASIKGVYTHLFILTSFTI